MFTSLIVIHLNFAQSFCEISENFEIPGISENFEIPGISENFEIPGISESRSQADSEDSVVPAQS